MLLAELSGTPVWLLHAIGAALLLGRIVHAWSLAASSLRARVVAMGLTFGVLVAGAFCCLAGALGTTF